MDIMIGVALAVVFIVIFYLQFLRGHRFFKKNQERWTRIWPPLEKDEKAADQQVTYDETFPSMVAPDRWPREITVELQAAYTPLFNCDLWDLVQLKIADLDSKGLATGTAPFFLTVTIGGRRSSTRPQAYIALAPDQKGGTSG